MSESFNFSNMDKLFEKITAAVVKSVGPDIRDYLADNPDETHNALKLVRGDKINTNLRNFVASDTVELKTFKRYAWEGRILIDREHKVTIAICTKQTLDAIPRKKDRTSPHYQMTIANVENADVEPIYEQMTLFSGMSQFSSDVYADDFKTIMGEDVLAEDGYKHLVVVYETSGSDVVTYISAKLIDRNLATAKEYSLDRFLKPDFGDLTAEFNDEETTQNDVRSLVTVKAPKQKNNATPKQDGLVTAKGQEEEKRA